MRTTYVTLYAAAAAIIFTIIVRPVGAQSFSVVLSTINTVTTRTEDLTLDMEGLVRRDLTGATVHIHNYI